MATQNSSAPTERVIEREVPVERASGGGGGNAVAIVLGFILLAVVILGVVFFVNYQNNQTIRTNAVSHAASSVAKSVDHAATGVSDAAQSAVGH